MGVTYARGSITGKSGSRPYEFLVDTGATWLSIPPADIGVLELEALGRNAPITTPNGVFYLPLYRADGVLEGVPFSTYLVEAYIPIVGYRLLQDLGFVVDVLEERIALRTEWLGNLP
ncbi:MAG: hypothetical protein J4G13_07860 [Dehalococcoidia bacterium]|nr:hypothetical protein [Dehalococcoidia bacterium]